MIIHSRSKSSSVLSCWLSVVETVYASIKVIFHISFLNIKHCSFIHFIFSFEKTKIAFKFLLEFYTDDILTRLSGWDGEANQQHIRSDFEDNVWTKQLWKSKEKLS